MDKTLADYKGPFDPKLRYADFSSEQLATLMRAWWNIGLRVPWFHERILAGTYGWKLANELHKELWVRIAPEEIDRMRQALGVTGNDVESLFKVMQNDIGFAQDMFDYTWELKNRQQGILRVHRCNGYDVVRDTRGEKYRRSLQQMADVFPAYTAAFNPKITVRCLKAPKPEIIGFAHRCEDDCAWEFTLDTSASMMPSTESVKERGKNLANYDGPFDPTLTYADFSREQLVKIMNAWWNTVMKMDWVHTELIAERCGREVADDCHNQIWVLIAPEEIALMREAFGVTGNDVESFFKIIQNDLGFPQEGFDVTWDLKNRNHGILRVDRCHFYDRIRDMAGVASNRYICDVLEMAAFPAYTGAFNPDIKVTCIQIPHHETIPPKELPRRVADCAWDFKLEE